MILLKFIVIFLLLKETVAYNDTVVFNWTKNPAACYVEDFYLSDNYRPYVEDIYPIRGCNSDKRNELYQPFLYNRTTDVAYSNLTNITFEPRLDYFFNNDQYPPQSRDPPTAMTFRMVNQGYLLYYFMYYDFHQLIDFGRSEDYHPIPKVSKRTGKPIEYIDNKAILPARFKLAIVQNKTINYDFSYSDYEIYDYEGYDFNVTFDGFTLNVSEYLQVCLRVNCKLNIATGVYYALIVKVYDLPRMKVQGLFQYRYHIANKEGPMLTIRTSIYTVDTRNVFFQNISMFYNQRVNVTNDGYEPTGEDSGFWINTPCNTPQMATIMVDYHFFDTIHRMQSYGFEFGDRFQLRIHTPYYRKNIMKEYSLFRYQWNETYPKPRVFIHPIYKYKEYCETYKNCTKFDYEEWSTDPKFTKYIIDIKHEIKVNQIWINFTELEKIYEADGFHRGKLVINVNNTMTPHFSKAANGLWAELVDLVTNDWVMKTKTTMDEVHGYTDDYEPDPYRNFFLTCEIPNNLTRDEVDIILKKYGVLQTAHIWLRIDVFNKGITKMFPQRFNTVIKFPPEIHITNETFMYTYQYFFRFGNYTFNNYYVLKDLRSTGIADGTFTNDTLDFRRNRANVSELQPNYPNGDDTLFYAMYHRLVCDIYWEGDLTCFNLTINRQYVYYFYDLELMYNTNNTGPIDFTVYQIRYFPYHAKNQINRGLHHWNKNHAGWTVPEAAIYKEKTGNIYRPVYAYYTEPWEDNFFYRNSTTGIYYNLLGSIAIKAYSGYDCVFSFKGGSTLRNTSCEFLHGLIPNMPFSNYARDTVEEVIAYRSISDYTFAVNTSIPEDMYLEQFYLTCHYPGRITGMTFFVGYFHFWVENEYSDNEPTCNKFTFSTPDCEYYLKHYGDRNPHKSVHNIHKYPNEFFGVLYLPPFLTVQSHVVGQVRKCHWEGFTTPDLTVARFNKLDYICYYANSSTVYFFNTVRGMGCINQAYDWDILLHLDGLYMHENYSMYELNSGLLKWGFFDDPFMYHYFPNNTRYLAIKNSSNVSEIIFERNSSRNDDFSQFNLTMIFKDTFHSSIIIRIHFDSSIKYMVFVYEYRNGEPVDPKIIEYAQDYGDFDKMMKYRSDGHEIIDKGTQIETPENVTYYLLYCPNLRRYRIWEDLKQNKSQINVTLSLNIINPRSIRKFHIYYELFDGDLACVDQKLNYTFINTEPQYLINMTVTPNSFFTGDRAVYKFNCHTFQRETLTGDVFIFKTSWKTKYNNNEEDPNDKGYYINRIYINKDTNITFNNMTIIGNFILNPETMDTHYIKGIYMIDKEGYLVSVCNETIPIKMKKITGFKMSEVSTEKTATNNQFDINFELVPEILIRKNDLLRIKFSSIVSLNNYPACKINSTKGLSLLDPDFECEIDKDNNELILKNAFKEIGENVSIFENLNSTALTDQQFIFSLKDIPMYSTSNDLENVYSIEIKTESNGIITQSNLLPSTAIFDCDSRCKTCNIESPSECLSCSDDFPIYYPQEKYCHKFCPKEKYYQIENEEGIKECLMCEEPCENCVGNSTNCTFCSEGYFMVNNSCVHNCSEDEGRDLILRRCYPLTKMNKNVIVDRTFYVNISIPEPYPVYIHRNVCMIDGL